MGIGVLCGLLAGAMWGIVFIAPAYLSAFTPLQLTVGRYLAYGVIALVLLGPRLRTLLPSLSRADLYALVRHALAGNLVYYVLLAYGVQYAGVGPTSLIVGMVPLVVTLLGRHDHGAVPLRRMLAPLLLVAVGIACINIDTFMHAPVDASGIAIAGGVLCATGALLCWSWYALDNARYLKNNPRFGSGEWSALYGLATGVLSLVLAPFAFWDITRSGRARLDRVLGLQCPAGAGGVGHWQPFLERGQPPRARHADGPADPVRNIVRAAVRLHLSRRRATAARTGGNCTADRRRCLVGQTARRRWA
jgi:drug/metabolite transporter (DMT)-like permease